MESELKISYQEIISAENLLAAWQEFICGKLKKKDVRGFGFCLIDNILQLSEELANFSYRHGNYTAFNISDPKPRHIHKATVRDRVLHHAVYRKLYPFFDKTFIADSYSCRIGKGVHKAINRFLFFGNQASKNHIKTVWVLKCDIKKFFASIDHQKLLEILAGHIPENNVMWLLQQVINSFNSNHPASAALGAPPLKGGETAYSLPLVGRVGEGIGLPLGNLTSQLFCNIYMNEFDQFVKHKLKAKYYLRYADDFVFLSQDRDYLENVLPRLADFLNNELKLILHPNKISLKTLASGVDFLGWVAFSKHRVLRTATRKRMFKRVLRHTQNETLQSYLGLLKHGNAYRLKEKLLNWYGLWREKEDNSLYL